MPLALLDQKHLPQAGAKAVTLGRMMRSGLPVPSGFVVTTAAFQRFVEAAPGWKALATELAGIGWANLTGIEPIRGRICDALRGQPLPVEVARAIQSALDEFSRVRLWAVRSSATVEDSPEASFAGQHDSFLNVRPEDILERVRQCWLSLFSPRAISYRAQRDVPHHRARMAVILQQMVPAEVSGVLFTADPVSGDTGRIVIEAAPGLGEQVVAGRVTPVRMVLAKSSRKILQRTSDGTPKEDPGADPEGDCENATTVSRPERTVLDDPTAQRLAQWSTRAEQVLSGPLDMEWARCGGDIYLLQARPVTGKPPGRAWEDRQVWTNINTGEVIPDVVTPITWSVLQFFFLPLIERVGRMHGVDARKIPVLGLVAGRVYFNLNTALATLKPFSFIAKKLSNLTLALGGGYIEPFRQGLLKIPDEDLPRLDFRWHKYFLSWPGILYTLIIHAPRRDDAWGARLKAQSDELAGIEIESMSTPELVQFFTDGLRKSFVGWDLLYLATKAVALAVFQKACRDWLGDPNLTLGYRLFSALGGVPEAEAGLALWRMAMLAHEDKPTEAVLLSGAGWPEVLAQLGRSEPGRKFLAAWDAFMREHGHHCRGELELFNARWSETPDYILGLVRSYLLTVEQANPVANQQRLARERQQLTEQCRQRLTNPIKRWIFTRALRRAQKLAVGREEWKNQAVRQITTLRRVLLLLGRRLHEQGVLARADDTFFLEVSEIEPVATGQAHFNVREVISARRKEYERNRTLSPPPVVVGRFGPDTPAPPGPDAGTEILRGIPVSPGIVTGPARVILRTDDHEQVLPGEILVAPFTDPAWTPYFVPAAGVVMDQGGILSHGSIVAREYGLPAVTNVGSATRLIRTGDRIQVDGNQGRVIILERA